MAYYYKNVSFKILIAVMALLPAAFANAQSAQPKPVLSYLAATGGKLHFAKDTVEIKEDSLSYSSAASAVRNVNFDAALLLNPEVSITKPQERRQLMGYLKKVTTNEEVTYNPSRTKFLYKLANVFTRLRLYPLAMKCFLKASAAKAAADSVQETDNVTYLAVNSTDDSLLSRQALLAGAANFNTKESTETTYKNITGTFDAGKKAVAYAMLFHVKQPAPGKRKLHVWGNTGHTFITLIKYNADSTYSAFSFGFYPKKSTFLSGTPVSPLAGSVFKNDTDHQWDEVLGKFISKRRFDKILSLVKQYDHLEYHLSNNNCTDFGLKAAQMAGINITGNTTGSWPLGHGNAPAITGQSILEGQFVNTDTGKSDDLFINTVVTPK